MSNAVTIPAVVLLSALASVCAPGRLARATADVHALLPGLFDPSLPKPSPKPREKVVATISLLQLRDAKYRRGQPLEDWIMELDGKFIAIEGYMAIGTLEGLQHFEFVPEECECGGSKVNHMVQVTLTDDVTRFKPGRFYMRGIFSAGEIEDDGFVVSVYRMRAREMPD